MLHVKRYLDYKRTYLETLGVQRTPLDSAYEFSTIDQKRGYEGAKTINAEMITTVWTYIMDNGGLEGFSQYMKSLATDKITNISWDATHSFAEKGKTTIANQKIATMKSLSVIVCNQNYIQSAIFTLSHRNVELSAQFEAFARHLDALKLARRDGYGRLLHGRHIVEKVGTDYTEKYGGMIKKVFPQCSQAQDVYHWLTRFYLGIQNGRINPYHAEVVASLSIAWRQSRTRDDIIGNFEALYTKYHHKGGIWNQLAKDIFDRQMQRVRAGWLDKDGDSANTSRVENKFRHIERVQATFSCSLQVFESLGLAKIDMMNRNNGRKRGDKLIIQTYCYSDVIYSNKIQCLEKRLFTYKSDDIATLPNIIDHQEEFGVVTQSGNQRQVCREEPDSEDMIVEEYDDEAADYLPQAIANDFLEQCELESLGLDASKRNQPELDALPQDNRFVPITQLLANVMPTLPSNAPQLPLEPYRPPPQTRTMTWFERRCNLPAEYFLVGQGIVYHLFMKLGRLHKWRSAAGETNFNAAELTWKHEIDAHHAKNPEGDRLPEYDSNTLRTKCIKVEKMLPKYLMFWQELATEGVEIYVNKEEEDCDVQKKIRYWTEQDLRENVPLTSACRKGKTDTCKRCNLRKVAGSGHSPRTCIDGALILLDTDVVRFPQPTDLFITKDGLPRAL